jgi:hypothetical protein
VNSPVLTFGDRCLQRLVEFADIDWTPYIIITEYAFAFDKDRYYWVLKTDEENYISLLCNKDFTGVSQGIIRKGKDGQEFAHRLPPAIEKELRHKVAYKIKQENLSSLSKENQEKKTSA